MSVDSIASRYVSPCQSLKSSVRILPQSVSEVKLHRSILAFPVFPAGVPAKVTVVKCAETLQKIRYFLLRLEPVLCSWHLCVITVPVLFHSLFRDKAETVIAAYLFCSTLPRFHQHQASHSCLPARNSILKER